jgi:hypothetical protein
MRTPHITVLFVALFTCGLLGSVLNTQSAHAQQGRVNMTVYLHQNAPITAGQDWATALGRASIYNVRITGGGRGEQPAIEATGSEYMKVYNVTGIIDTRGRIVVPGQTFSTSEVTQLTAWLDELAAQGPVSERPTEATFFMQQGDFVKVIADLEPVVGEVALRTGERALSKADIVRAIASELSYPLIIEDGLLNVVLRGAYQDDVSRLARGTALAAVLDSAGLAFAPERTDAGSIQYTVHESPDTERSWPIGRSVEGTPREIMPQILESIDANIPGNPITVVARSVGGMLQKPIIFDLRAIRRIPLNLEDSAVSMAPRRAMYTTVLTNTLRQLELKFEFRVDDGGRTFLWIVPARPITIIER